MSEIKKPERRSPLYHGQAMHASAVELTPDHLRDIETAASKITIQGARYPEHIEQMSNR
jgi:hypothetical protein